MLSAFWIYALLGFVPGFLLLQETGGATVSSTTASPSSENDEIELKEIHLWPDAIIPYVIPEDTYSEKQIGTILSSMRSWSYKTCIKFVPWSDEIEAQLGTTRHLLYYGGGNCFSDTGINSRQPQVIGIGTRGCVTMDTVVHELGHAIGMVHTMERNDRNPYITVHSENMKSASYRNFLTSAEKGVHFNFFDTPYDYKSIMHYSQKTYSSNGKPVLVTHDPMYQSVIGKTTGVSFFDALYVNTAYNCSDRCSSSLEGICKNGGFIGGSDCHCICHDGYTGEFCDVLLPGYQHIAWYRCQSGWTYADGKCYLFFPSMVSFMLSEMICQNDNASFVMFKSRPQMETIRRLVEEEAARTDFKSFWIGLKRSPGSESDTWLDGTVVDPNLVVPRVGVEDEDQELCAYYDGSDVSLTTCSYIRSRTVICVKDFDDTCGGRYYIPETSSRLIQSPGFPDHYPKGIKCEYLLQAQENSKISLTFTNFTLQDDCNKDYLEVRLTADVTEDGISYCGTDLQGKTLVSDSNIAMISLVTNSRDNYQGFLVSAQATPLYSWTTPSPFSLLDAISKKIDQVKKVVGNEILSLSSIWNVIKGMTFPKIL